MSIYIGNTKIGQMYLGSTEIAQAYLGSVKVYDKGGLPYDAQVEYLESSGTQYIDTGLFVTSNNLKISMRIYTASMPSVEQDIIGNQDDSTGRFVLGLYGGYVFGYTRSNLGSESNVDSTTFAGANTLDIEYILDNSNSTKYLAVNGLVTSNNYIRSIINSNNTVKLYVDGTTKETYRFIGRIYYVKIYQDDTLHRDLIPVRVGQVGYMYDRVSGQLFGNSGTGDFILGQDIVPVEYLESSGTQYIDTGIVPNDETGFYVRAYCTTSGGNHGCFGARGDSPTDDRCWINFSTTIEFAWNTYVTSVSNYTNTWVEIEHNLFNSRTGTLDGVVKRSNYPTLASITRNVYLFGVNSTNGASILFTGRISRFKISQGSDVVMDMIPVRKNSVGYMYDQVSGQLFGNAGSGSFVLGNDITT